MLQYNQAASLLSLTTSLSSFSRSLIRYPTRSPNSHLPISSAALCLVIWSMRCSNSLAMISPAAFLQLGLVISSFMASILTCSFLRVSLILTNSPASLSSWVFMYSRMYFSLSLKTSSTMWQILSLRFLNSPLITFSIRPLKLSILQLIPVISFRSLLLRLSRHCTDSTRADQKLVEQDTRPVHMLFRSSPSFPRASPRTLSGWRGGSRGRGSGTRRSLRGSNSSKDPKRVSLAGRLVLALWMGEYSRWQLVVVFSWGLKRLRAGKGFSWSWLVAGRMSLERSLERLRLERLRLMFLEGELEKRDCFLRKVRRLLSLLLIGINFITWICHQQEPSSHIYHCCLRLTTQQAALDGLARLAVCRPNFELPPIWGHFKYAICPQWLPLQQLFGMSEGGEFMNAEEFQSMLRVWCLGIGINKPPEELLHRIKELVDKEGENRITQDEANRTLERVLSFMYKNKR